MEVDAVNSMLNWGSIAFIAIATIFLYENAD